MSCLFDETDPPALTLPAPTLAPLQPTRPPLSDGTIVVPAPKTFLVAALTITRSATELHIEEGATLLVSDDRSRWPGSRHVISARNVEHVAITGAGTVDGQGLEWWRHRDDFRPHMVDMSGVRNAVLRDTLYLNAPSHVLELGCDNCELSGVRVLVRASGIREGLVVAFPPELTKDAGPSLNRRVREGRDVQPQHGRGRRPREPVLCPRRQLYYGGRQHCWARKSHPRRGLILWNGTWCFNRLPLRGMAAQHHLSQHFVSKDHGCEFGEGGAEGEVLGEGTRRSDLSLSRYHLIRHFSFSPGNVPPIPTGRTDQEPPRLYGQDLGRDL